MSHTVSSIIIIFCVSMVYNCYNILAKFNIHKLLCKVYNLHSGSFFVFYSSMIFHKCIIPIYLSLQYHRVVSLTWNFSVLHLFILPSVPPNQSPLYCLHSFDFFRMSYSWNHTICSILNLDIFPSNMHLSWLYVFL